MKRFGRILSAALAVLAVLLCAGCGGSAYRRSDFSDALRGSEIEDILILGDSITDGNGDYGCLWTNEDRIAASCRHIITDEYGINYYENAIDSQGWVSQFYAYAAENTTVQRIDNSAIGGKSAKWYNAHRETLIGDGYDAILVMLGTNDRTDCADEAEFLAEYGSLLSYADAHTSHLVVFAPIPALYDLTEDAKNMTARQIADAVVRLCADRGYCCVNLYEEYPAHAARCGDALGSYYFGSTHPCHTGYVALWQTIAEALDLLPANHPNRAAQSEPVDEITCVGSNRADVDGDTPPDARDAQGRDIYPVGTSWYYTWNPFTDTLPWGAFVETHRAADGTATQIARRTDYLEEAFPLTRSYANGQWSARAWI